MATLARQKAPLRDTCRMFLKGCIGQTVAAGEALEVIEEFAWDSRLANGSDWGSEFSLPRTVSAVIAVLFAFAAPSPVAGATPSSMTPTKATVTARPTRTPDPHITWSPAATQSGTRTPIVIPIRTRLQRSTPFPTSTETRTCTPGANPAPGCSYEGPTLTATLTRTPTATRTRTTGGHFPICVGDCDDDRTVLIAEIVRGTAMALSGEWVGACHFYAVCGCCQVCIAGLVEAVANSLRGCFWQPTPTRNPTRTPTPTPDDPVWVALDPLLRQRCLEDGPAAYSFQPTVLGYTMHCHPWRGHERRSSIVVYGSENAASEAFAERLAFGESTEFRRYAAIHLEEPRETSVPPVVFERLIWRAGCILVFSDSLDTRGLPLGPSVFDIAEVIDDAAIDSLLAACPN